MRKELLIGLLCIMGMSSWAQSADRIAAILNSETVTYGQISYLAASSLGLISDDASDEEAIDSLIDNKIVKAKHMGKEDDAVPLANMCNICCATWYIVDSINYNIFKNPYYAWKQMRAFNYIPASYTGEKLLSGSEALTIITHCIEHHERDMQERAIRSAIEEEERQHEKYW